MTALWAEGCGGGFAAIFKVSRMLIMSYDMISILLTGSLRSPPPFPAAPDFPRKRWQNNPCLK